MSKARKILMIIAVIASICLFAVCALCAIALLISASDADLLAKMLDALNKDGKGDSAGKIYVLSIGFLFALLSFLEIINIIVTIKGIKSNKPVIMVLNIVFGFIGGIYINSLGGIFGLCESKE